MHLEKLTFNYHTKARLHLCGKDIDCLSQFPQTSGAKRISPQVFVSSLFFLFLKSFPLPQEEMTIKQYKNDVPKKQQ